MNRDEAPLETNVSGFDGFDFMSQESNTRFDCFEEFVVKSRTFVVGKSRHNFEALPYVYSSMNSHSGKLRIFAEKLFGIERFSFVFSC